MNLESVLGPNASFGLGPMKSLSFGLGFGASIDYGDNPRASPISIHRLQSSRLFAGSPRDQKGADLSIDESEDMKRSDLQNKENRGNIQVLHASPSNSFGNVIRATNGDTDGNGRGGSIMVLGDAVRVATPPPLVDKKRNRSPSLDSVDSKKHDAMDDERQKSRKVVMNRNAHQLPFRTRSNRLSPFRERNESENENAKSKESNKLDKSPQIAGVLPTAKSRKLGIDPVLFGVMKRHETVFHTFEFLLPGAKTVLKAVTSDGRSSGDRWKNNTMQLTDREREIARRRVNSALCAFGGVAITPDSGKSSAHELAKSRSMQEYREKLADRYYEEENRLSWEIESDPPVEVSEEEDGADPENVSIKGKVSSSSDLNDRNDEKSENYRCKLCGRMSRNHTCPFQTSLQRNMGVMVYPAVNAFTATEPGIITPALSEMNNFVDSNKTNDESTPAKIQTKEPLSGSRSSSKQHSGVPMVSPDSIRIESQNSPLSNSSSDGKSPRQRTLGSEGNISSVNYAGGAWISNHQSPSQKINPGKQHESPSTDLLFVDVQELRPEQYRIVSQKRRKILNHLYDYPTLPLPYGQRKRLSNAMFAMSKSIPGLTDECGLVLGEARRKDAWDFAVAQLMTQVIVLTHCSVEDSRLDGLSKYLLTLGWVS